MSSQLDPHLTLEPRRGHTRLEHLGHWSSSNRIMLTRAYIVAVLLLGLVFQLAYPITAGDSDMWYHLAGGRHFWTTGEVPNTSFFSFIEPQRVWTNYFWGFQALIYKIHDFGGYQALVAFRALMFFCLSGAIALFLLHGEAWKVRPGPILLLFIIFFLLFEGRSLQIRPHLFSYLFIVAFIGILEYKPRWAPVLPILAVFWINAHGIEYVVGTLICGAYFLEAAFLKYVLRRRLEERGVLFLLSLTACAFTVLLNPHGLSIFLTPFAIPAQIDLFVTELQPLPEGFLYPVVLKPTIIGTNTCFTLLFITSLLAWLYVAVKRKIRISHTLMALGGIFLLTKGYRFIWEWSLLSLPLLSTFVNSYSKAPPSRSSCINGALLLAVLCVPFISLSHIFSKRIHAEFASSQLPIGIVRFLGSSGLKGNLVAPPHQAGYMQWKLNPGILIHSNMELPPFNLVDIFEVQNAFRDTDSLRNLTSRYDIHFLSVNRETGEFPKVIASFPQFKPVFFDDQQVLYANGSFFPDFVSEFQLQSVDPFNLFGESREPEKQILELKRMRAEFPEGKRVNHALVRLLFWKGEYSGALEYARALMSHHPRNPYGYYWAGRILENTERCVEAIDYFKKASHHADGELARLLNIRSGNCHFVLKNFSQAYEHLSKGLNPIVHATESKDLYLLALSASYVERDREAVAALQMLLNQEGDHDNGVRSDAERTLAAIRSGEL